MGARVTPTSTSSRDLLRALAEGTAGTTGDDFFRSLARHAALALGARFAFVAESLSDLESRSLAYWEGTGFGNGFSYRFPGTPCARVAQGHVCATSTRLQALYPEDVWLRDIGADSYIGVPMKTGDGRVLGHIAVLHTDPMEPCSEDITVLQIFAARGSAELERVQADRRLREALAEISRLRERLQQENGYLRDEIAEEHGASGLIGDSPSVRALLGQITSVAQSDATVLIEGETGTGKELVARAVHQTSSRRDRALVKVNCGAIPTNLVESELFGHEKGAFTGALSRRIGRFALADGGTIFLDEVAELPVDAQVKLLRVLQEQEFEPVGDGRTQKVDVRVLAATNRSLVQLVEEGRFRADLYYRLAVIPLLVPPLRDRAGDVARLALHFLLKFAKKMGRPVRGIDTASLARLERYSFPGNVRELENLIERAVVLSSGPLLTIEEILLGTPKQSKRRARSSRSSPGFPTSTS
jgi:transcriptional regulator with GAF, ATPase, and Fis domain